MMVSQISNLENTTLGRREEETDKEFYEEVAQKTLFE